MVEITNKEIYHVKVAAICRIIMNVISYMRAENLTLIYACRVIHNLHYIFTRPLLASVKNL